MWPMKCMQCDAVVQRNKMPFHVREVHGPMGSRNRNAPVEPAQPLPPHTASWEGFRAREASPPPDVQEDRTAFKATIQKIVREFGVLSLPAIKECSDGIGNMSVLGVSSISVRVVPLVG